MEFLMIVLFVGIAAFQYAAKSGKTKEAAEKTRQALRGADIPAVKTKKRAAMRETEKWRAAKQQQDDAEQLHAIHIDSCESKLESLRVLHEAGILDNEEYAERVARTKARHAQGGSK